MLQKMTGTIRVRLHLDKVMDLSLMPQAMSINILGVNHIRVALCGELDNLSRYYPMCRQISPSLQVDPQALPTQLATRPSKD